MTPDQERPLRKSDRRAGRTRVGPRRCERIATMSAKYLVSYAERARSGRRVCLLPGVARGRGACWGALPERDSALGFKLQSFRMNYTPITSTAL